MRSNLPRRLIDQVSKITGSQQQVAGPSLKRFQHVTGVAGNNPLLQAGMLVLLGLGGKCAASGGGRGEPQPQPPAPIPPAPAPPEPTASATPWPMWTPTATPTQGGGGHGH